MFEDKYEYLPYGKYVDFYVYHNNYSEEDLTIGVLLKCESWRNYPVTIDKFYEMKTGGNDNKYIRYAELGKDFLNKVYGDEKDKSSVEMRFGDIGFAIANNVPNNSGVNGILRIKCDSSFVKARVVAVKSKFINKNTDWNKIWEEGLCIEEGNSKKDGQFAGSINYSQISVKAKMKVGQFFSLAGPRNQNSGNEYPNPIDYKEAGRNFLFGNYGVVYNIEISVEDKQKDKYYIEIYPFGHNTANNQDLILYTKRYGFYTTGAINGIAAVTKSDDPKYTHIIKTSYLKDNNNIKKLKAHKKVGFILGNDKDNNVIRFKFVLPGAGSGNVKFKLVDNKTCDDSTLV